MDGSLHPSDVGAQVLSFIPQSFETTSLYNLLETKEKEHCQS